MKKFLSLILIICIAVSLVSCGPKTESTGAKPRIDVVSAYVDVAEDDWYKDSVDWGVNENIMQAAKPNMFGSSTPITKEQALLAMWKAAGAPGQVISAKNIPDSDPNSDLSKAMAWAELYGVINKRDKIKNSSVISRLDAIEYMWNQAENPVILNSENFEDTQGIDSVLWAKTNKITFGVGNNLFAPKTDCTKAMMITFLYRAK